MNAESLITTTFDGISIDSRNANLKELSLIILSFESSWNEIDLDTIVFFRFGVSGEPDS